MATDWKEIREALVTAMEQVSGINAIPYVQDRFPIPCAYVNRDSSQYHQTFDPASTDEGLTITILLSRTNIRQSQEQLDIWLEGSGNDSLVEAIESAVFADTACKAKVIGMRDYGGLRIGDDPFIGAVLEVILLR